MKLIIQIPCYNEAETLPETFAELPQAIDGVDCIETLIVDDGSEDDTIAVARSLGVTHIVEQRKNRGLAHTFQTGIVACLTRGADIIVTTDGDNQYPGHFIPVLAQPILDGDADIVVGDRQVDKIPHFSPIKRLLQKFGSWMVRTVSETAVPDAPSGFRAYTRDAALHFNILTRFSYTLETIIQAGKLGLTITSVPIETNDPTRPSRLQRNMWHFIKAQAGTILRLYAFYEPLRTFSYIAFPFLLTGLLLWARFGYVTVVGQSGVGRYGQSVTIGTGLILVGVITLLFGIQADIAGKHRQLTQEMVYRLKKLELREQGSGESESMLQTPLCPKPK